MAAAKQTGPDFDWFAGDLERDKTTFGGARRGWGAGGKLIVEAFKRNSHLKATQCWPGKLRDYPRKRAGRTRRPAPSSPYMIRRLLRHGAIGVDEATPVVRIHARLAQVVRALCEAVLELTH